ncbi:unnamed protein product, partial [Clonostachys rosea f. rosea IK726]
MSPRDLHKLSPSSISLELRIISPCANLFPDDDSEGRTSIQLFREKRIPKAHFSNLNKVFNTHWAFKMERYMASNLVLFDSYA